MHHFGATTLGPANPQGLACDLLVGGMTMTKEDLVAGLERLIERVDGHADGIHPLSHLRRGAGECPPIGHQLVPQPEARARPHALMAWASAVDTPVHVLLACHGVPEREQFDAQRGVELGLATDGRARLAPPGVEGDVRAVGGKAADGSAEDRRARRDQRGHPDRRGLRRCLGQMVGGEDGAQGEHDR